MRRGVAVIANAKHSAARSRERARKCVEGYRIFSGVTCANFLDGAIKGFGLLLNRI